MYLSVRLASGMPKPARLLRRLYSTTPSSDLTTTTIPLRPDAPGHILIASLNRPHTRNALSRSLVSSLSSILTSIHAQDPSSNPESQTRALIIASSSNSAFCAGADLKERKGMSVDDTRLFLTSLRSTIDLLESLPIPSISAIAAPALGGGLELALATTLRVFASSTTVGLPESRLAIIPGAGGTFRLSQLIGLARARDLILTGRRVSAPEAYFLGLCDRLVEVVPEDSKDGDEPADSANRLATRARTRTLEGAVELAREIAAGGPIAIRAALKAVGKGPEAEEAAYNTVLGTTDRLEALAAFSEKRRPVYKGE